MFGILKDMEDSLDSIVMLYNNKMAACQVIAWLIRTSIMNN